MSDRLARRYAYWLRFYPPGPRRAEMLATLLECAPPERTRPTGREILNLIVYGLRARLGHPASTAVVVLAVLVALASGLLGAAAAARIGWWPPAGTCTATSRPWRRSRPRPRSAPPRSGPPATIWCSATPGRSGATGRRGLRRRGQFSAHPVRPGLAGRGRRHRGSSRRARRLAAVRVGGTTWLLFHHDPHDEEYRYAYCDGGRLTGDSGMKVPYFWEIGLSSPGVFPALASEVTPMPGVVAVRHGRAV
jgi:hypothetical protein